MIQFHLKALLARRIKTLCLRESICEIASFNFVKLRKLSVTNQQVSLSKFEFFKTAFSTFLSLHGDLNYFCKPKLGKVTLLKLLMFYCIQ